MRKIGIIPARMASSRFPGKPLHPIAGKPLLQHVFDRASQWTDWDQLVIATPDDEIRKFALQIDAPFVMTDIRHVRGLDRVGEAARLTGFVKDSSDIVVNVQGDEPLLEVEMFRELCHPFEGDDSIHATVLSMPVADEEEWLNPDTVKIIANDSGEVLYTSRSPVPFSENGFTSELDARKIFGLFAFRAPALQEFCAHPETRLERLETCDSNRILSMNFRQHAVRTARRETYAVDRLEDAMRVEKVLGGM